MNRPSLAPVRRAQILDAVEVCILEYGIEGVSFSRVARVAGVRTSMVPHYFGTKGALMAAMVDRVLDRVEALLDAAVDGATGRARIERLLGLLFGGTFAVPNVILVVDQLRASAYFNETTRQRLVAMFGHLEQLAEGALADAYPDASPDQCRAVAYSLLCLSDANNSFRGIGFPSEYDDRARVAAEILLSGLGDGSSVALRA